MKPVEARRLAIAATGLGAPRPAAARITTAHLRKVVQTVGIVQMDSVNAVARAHELVFFSRLGPFDPKVLHDLVYRLRELYEGWLHEACLLPVELWPYLGWRRRNHGWHTAIDSPVVDEVRRIVRE